MGNILDGPKGFYVIFDITVSLLAILGNSLILDSVIKVNFDLIAVSDLYICGINLLGFAHSAVLVYSPNSQIERCGTDFLRSLQFVGFFANLLNLCGMSVDHFVGIIYPLRYVNLMNKKVIRIAVVAIWVTSFVLGFADFPIATALYLTKRYNYADQREIPLSFPAPGDGAFDTEMTMINFHDNFSVNYTDSYESYDGLGSYAYDLESLLSNYSSPESFLSTTLTPELLNNIAFLLGNETNDVGSQNVEKTLYEEILNIVQHKKDDMDWCAFYLANKVWLEFSVITLTLACFVFLIICYGRIFREVFVNIDSSERNTRKLVVTTFLLLGAFTICWLPFMIFEFSMIMVLKKNDGISGMVGVDSEQFLVVNNIFNSLLMCYPLLDPIIYAARMRVIRRYILSKYGRFFPCCRSLIRQASMRRTSVFTYSLTSQNFTSTLALTKSSDNVNQNTLKNSRQVLIYGNSDNYRRLSVNASKRGSASGASNCSNVFETSEPFGDFTLTSPPLRNLTSPRSSSSKSVSEDSNECLHMKLGCESCDRSTAELIADMDPALYPPLIYRRGNSFKRQVREMYANQFSDYSSRKRASGKMRNYSSNQVNASMDRGHRHGLEVSYDKVNDIVETRSFSNSTRRWRSSNHIPHNFCQETLDEGSDLPTHYEKSTSIIVSSGVPSSSVVDSLHDSGLGDNEAKNKSTNNPAILLRSKSSGSLQCRIVEPPDDDSLEFENYRVLQRTGCPCSEFANSQAVVDKFHGNSLRLFGIAPAENVADSHVDNDVKGAFVGRSPTTGDFSSPCEDLLVRRIKTTGEENRL